MLFGPVLAVVVGHDYGCVMAVKVVVVIGGPMVWVIVMEDGDYESLEKGSRPFSRGAQPKNLVEIKKNFLL